MGAENRRSAVRGGMTGFTAVELLGTLALTAVLMLAILSVVSSAARTRVALAARQHTEATLPAVLRRDLIQATDVQAAGGVLTMNTYGLLDPATGEPAGRPGRVIYRVQMIRGTPWLMREQSLPFAVDLPARGAGSRWIELVSPDVASLVVEKLPGERGLRLVLQSSRAGVAAVDEELWRE